MNWLGMIVQIVSIVLQGLILTLLLWRKLWRGFPFFASYVAYDLARTIVGSATLSKPHAYFYVYWFTAPGEMILMILAAHESFQRVFRSFYLLRWFRVLLPGTIVSALAYSAWKGFVSPPLHASPAGAAIISAALTAQYIVLSIAILFFSLTILLHVPRRIHEYRIVLGFAISSLAVAFGGAVRSVFVTRFGFLSQTLPAVAYILVLAVWLSAVRRAEPTNEHNLEQVSGHQMVNELRRRSELIRSFLRRG